MRASPEFRPPGSAPDKKPASRRRQLDAAAPQNSEGHERTQVFDLNAALAREEEDMTAYDESHGWELAQGDAKRARGKKALSKLQVDIEDPAPGLTLDQVQARSEPTEAAGMNYDLRELDDLDRGTSAQAQEEDMTMFADPHRIQGDVDRMRARGPKNRKGMDSEYYKATEADRDVLRVEMQEFKQAREKVEVATESWYQRVARGTRDVAKETGSLLKVFGVLKLTAEEQRRLRDWELDNSDQSGIFDPKDPIVESIGDIAGNYRNMLFGDKAKNERGLIGTLGNSLSIYDLGSALKAGAKEVASGVASKARRTPEELWDRRGELAEATKYVLGGGFLSEVYSGVKNKLTGKERKEIEAILNDPGATELSKPVGIEFAVEGMIKTAKGSAAMVRWIGEQYRAAESSLRHASLENQRVELVRQIAAAATERSDTFASEMDDNVNEVQAAREEYQTAIDAAEAKLIEARQSLLGSRMTNKQKGRLKARMVELEQQINAYEKLRGDVETLRQLTPDAHTEPAQELATG